MAPRKKKIAAVVKVQLQAGAATPAPPVGTALGPHGVNIMDFCRQYNAATEAQRGNVIPVEITIFEDRSFSFVTKTPPAAELLKKAAGVAKGSGEPLTAKVGSVTAAQVREIAQTKMPDLNATTIEAAEKIIAGTARSMGLTVSGWRRRENRVSGRASAGPTDHNPTIQRRTREAQQGIPPGRREDRPGAALQPRRGHQPGQGHAPDQVRRHRRGRPAARRGPAQGGPDGPRHGQPAQRHRQDRPRAGLRHRRPGRGGHGRRRRLRGLATT